MPNLKWDQAPTLVPDTGYVLDLQDKFALEILLMISSIKLLLEYPRSELSQRSVLKKVHQLKNLLNLKVR